MGTTKTEKNGRECYHCRQWLTKAELRNHDCWTTTEEKLTNELPEDILDAWYRIRETAQTFGEQRIYASHKSIMFARKHCYFYVRPKPARLEVCFFLGRTVKDPSLKKTYPASKVKVAHLIYVQHRDEVETPLTEWLREAYDASEVLRRASTKKSAPKKRATRKPGKKNTRRKKTN